MKKVFIWAIAAMCGLNSYAEGYQVNLQGNRQTGMGHTGAGLLMGASSIHFNPGALSFLQDKYEFSFGGSAIFSKNTFQKQAPSVYEAKSDNPVGTPFYFYGATKVTDQLAIGLSVTTPFGNSLSWEKDWDGRYLIQDISLRAIFIQPTISYQITEKLGVGVGFVAGNGNVDLNKALPIYGQDGAEGNVNLAGNTWAFGYNAGITYKASDALTLGLNYRSKILMKVDGGDATFNVPTAVSGLYPNTKFDAELPMPANLTFGVGYQATEKLLLAFDLQHVEWSAYKSLDFDFEAETVPDSHNQRDFENTLIYRLGAEYALQESFQLRAGIYYDSTPIPDDLLTPETPGTNKIGISAGFTWKASDKLAVDGSLLYIHGQKREDGYAPSDFYGTYYTNAVIPGIGITYSF
ncbi:OmpP1/FadL family transporter [Carboxylicivirga linearis]|uniref:Outer membrane protein transport protein n=1 Tax=Carboxylicivirga linearis TaxID=1628157 RepID=A0ABS5JRV0_9BACT|nr:outer membrane protein transport protein [Carboxylicivirga linearis]MBS2097542.1 outer membrane protein transport protein [Carboxylicivirga linearis]